MSIAKTVFKNSIYLYTADIISRLSSAFITILIARTLGSADLGRFSYVNSVVAILSAISSFGLTTYLVRQASKDQEKDLERFHSEIFTLRFLINTVVAVGLFFYAQFFINDNSIKILFHLSNLASLLSVYYTHWALVFRVRERMEFEGIINVLASFIYGIVGVLLIYFKQGIVSIAVLMLFLVIIRTILFAGFAKSILKLRLFVMFSFSDFVSICKQAYPFALMTIIGVVYFKIDIVLIEHFLGISAVGFYSASYRIMEMLMVIPGILAGAILPTISKKLDENPQLILKSSLQALKILNIISLPLVVGGFLLAKNGIILIYSNRFAESVPVFQILIWTLIPLFNSAITSTIINASKKPIINTYLACANLMANIGLNLILIPKIGIIGGAIATLVNETVGLILGYIYIRKKIFNLDFYKDYPKIILATTGMVFSILLFRNNIYFIPLYIIIYAMLLFILKIFNQEDITLLKKIWPQGLSLKIHKKFRINREIR